MSERIDPADLLAGATRLTGLSDFGDPAFRAPFEQLVRAVDAAPALDTEGRAAFTADMTRLLCSRLAIQAAVTEHPEILAEEVDDPLVITGLARTGTTKLHRALAAHSGLQRLLLWQGLFPTPWGPPGPERDPRIVVTEQQVAALAQRFPQMMAMHPVAAEEPEEEVLLLQLSFRTIGSPWICHAYPFVEWVLAQDQRPAYADLRRALQYLQWQDGGRRGRPWLLKAPVHLGALQVLLETFPRATVVHCHRDPEQVMGSAALLQELFHAAYGADDVPLDQLGRNALLSAHGWAQNIAQRPAVDPARVLDVEFAEICTDVVAVAARALRQHGIEPSAEAIAAIQKWDRDNPRDRHGRAEYSLDRYGLTSDQIRAAFADYTGYFARA